MPKIINPCLINKGLKEGFINYPSVYLLSIWRHHQMMMESRIWSH